MAPSALNRENCIFFVHCDAPRVESMTERAEFNSRKFEFEKLSKRLLHTSRWDNNAHIRSTDGRTYMPSWPDYGVLRDNFFFVRGSASSSSGHETQGPTLVRSCPSTLFETQDPAEMAYHVR